jgi:hypothetical protein
MVCFSVVPGPLGSRHNIPTRDWPRQLYRKWLNANRAAKGIYCAMDMRLFALHTSQPVQLTLSIA